MISFNTSPSYRQLFIGLDEPIPLLDGSIVTAVNLDNAATTAPLKATLQAVNKLAPWYSSIHRGSGYKSSYTTDFYEQTKNTVADFVRADTKNNSVIYTKNTSEAINLLSRLIYADNPRQTILTTEMEHHSNLLPWLCRFQTILLKTDKHGVLSLDDLETELKKGKGKIRFVAVSGASNVTGHINPVHEIASICHRFGALLIVDGAQLIPHSGFDIYPNDHASHIDFVAFSAHKLYAPFGCGVLIGPRSFFQNHMPEQLGGGTVKFVTRKKIAWAEPPDRFEAGTPNVMGAAALSASISTLSSIGLDQIQQYEASLYNYALLRLRGIPGIKFYGMAAEAVPKQILIHQSGNLKQHSKKKEMRKQYLNQSQLGIIPINLEGLRHETVAELLSSKKGIAVRSGCFCAHLYVQKLLAIDKRQREFHLKHANLPTPGMVRISFSLYNTFHEVDLLVEALLEIVSSNSPFYNKHQ